MESSSFIIFVDCSIKLDIYILKAETTTPRHTHFTGIKEERKEGKGERERGREKSIRNQEDS